MPSTNLAKLIVNPQQIVRILEWNKSAGAVMAIDVGCKGIGLAFAAHPSEDQTIHPFKSVNFSAEHEDEHRKSKSSEIISNELKKISYENKVHAFVVSWPLEKNGGVGRSCGRVLHLLDSMAVGSKPLLSQSRPFVLWEEGHEIGSSVHMDKWGRSEIFSRVPPSNQKEYISTMSFDGKVGDSLVACHMLKDFMDTHYQTQSYNIIKSDTNAVNTSYVQRSSSIDGKVLDGSDSNASFVHSNLL